MGTSLFQCRWLSARCRIGWPDGTRRAFRHAGAPLDTPRWRVLRLIEPAVWTANKTDAIDPTSNFWWLDDDPTDDARYWLRAHRREDRLIQLSADQDPAALAVARSILARAISIQPNAPD